MPYFKTISEEENSKFQFSMKPTYSFKCLTEGELKFLNDLNEYSTSFSDMEQLKKLVKEMFNLEKTDKSIRDWRFVLRDLEEKNNTIPCHLVLALIDSMYLTNKIIDSLSHFGYDLELGLINKLNLDSDSEINKST
jgi:hypothetical protein